MTIAVRETKKDRKYEVLRAGELTGTNETNGIANDKEPATAQQIRQTADKDKRDSLRQVPLHFVRAVGHHIDMEGLHLILTIIETQT